MGITACRDGPPAPSIPRDDPFVAHVLVVAALAQPGSSIPADGLPSQAACRTGSYATFKEYSELIKSRCTLRGLMKFKSAMAAHATLPVEVPS